MDTRQLWFIVCTALIIMATIINVFGVLAIVLPAWLVKIKTYKVEGMQNIERAKAILEHGTCHAVVECKYCQFGRSIETTCPHIIRGTPEGMKIVRDYLDCVRLVNK